MAIQELALGLADQYGGLKDGAQEILRPVFADLAPADLAVLYKEFGDRQEEDTRFKVLFEYVDTLVK